MHKVSPTNHELHTELRIHTEHRATLLDAMPGLDDETLADTLEGLTDLHEMIAALTRSALLDQALATGLKQRISEMRERRGRLETRALKKRDLVFGVMRDGQITKIIDPEFTASLKKAAPAVSIDEESLIPKAFWEPQPPKLDRQAILAALKQGDVITGAHLVTGNYQLSVRTK